jgi:hypothetical protein
MAQGNKKLKTEFYLVNTNTSWLKQNFKFIQAFYAGTNWLHLTQCQVRPPNVYHVLCPGRFQIYWAAIDMTVTFEGKLRKNEEASKFFRDEGILSIDENMLWPEAWKVEVNINDLTPGNFNLYAEYYEHGFKAEEIATLEKDIQLADAITDLVGHMKDLTNEMKKNMDKAISDFKKSAAKEAGVGENAELGDIVAGLAKNLGFGEKKEKNDEKK